MFEFVGNIVSGGWNALANITSGVGKGMSSIGSAFFPAPQKTTVISETVQAANSSGQTYRPVSPEFQSLLDENIGLINEWRDQPQQNWASITPKPKTWSDNLANILQGISQVGQATTAIRTVVTDIGQDWGLIPRQTVIGTPRAGTAEGTNDIHYNTEGTTGANVIEIVKGMGSAFIDQVKGLFNLGFEGGQGAQPGFAIKHELQPSTGTWIGLAIAGGVILLIVFLGRKR